MQTRTRCSGRVRSARAQGENLETELRWNDSVTLFPYKRLIESSNLHLISGPATDGFVTVSDKARPRGLTTPQLLTQYPFPL
jgi:hypothetical protein